MWSVSAWRAVDVASFLLLLGSLTIEIYVWFLAEVDDFVL